MSETTTTKSRTREYQIYAGMKQRCLNPRAGHYQDYGGRGIMVCDRWLESFDNFIADMGPRPTSKHTLERRENNGHYEPNNCYWATRKEQANNRRSNRLVEFRGEKITIPQLAEKFGLIPITVISRINSGLSPEQAIGPLLFKKKYDYKGMSVSIPQLARMTGMKPVTIHARLVKGDTVEEAVSRPVKSPNREPRTFQGRTMSVSDWAKSAGLSLNTFLKRLNDGWSFEDAVTVPSRRKR